MEYPQLLLPVLGNGLGNNNKQLGRVGELMVCLELEKLGYHTSLVEAEGYDIIVNVLNKPVRLQVKSSGTTDKHSAKGGRPRYNFSTSVGKVKRKLTKLLFIASLVSKVELKTALPESGRATPTAFLGCKSIGSILLASNAILYYFLFFIRSI